MMKNFGQTAQDIPNVKFPDINRSHSMNQMPQQMPNMVKGQYMAKRVKYAKKKRQASKFESDANEIYAPEPPPISDHDINQGMIHLVNRGIIPKDIDLTPAFERGAAPLQLAPAQIHPGQP